MVKNWWAISGFALAVSYAALGVTGLIVTLFSPYPEIYNNDLISVGFMGVPIGIAALVLSAIGLRPRRSVASVLQDPSAPLNTVVHGQASNLAIAGMCLGGLIAVIFPLVGFGAAYGAGTYQYTHHGSHAGFAECTDNRLEVRVLEWAEGAVGGELKVRFTSIADGRVRISDDAQISGDWDLSTLDGADRTLDPGQNRTLTYHVPAGAPSTWSRLELGYTYEDEDGWWPGIWMVCDFGDDDLPAGMAKGT